MDDQGRIKVGVKGTPIPNHTPFPDPVVLERDQATHFACRVCGTEYPKEKVVIDRADGRVRYVCINCRSEIRRAKQRKKRQDELNSELNKIISQGKRMKSREELPGLGDLVRGMIRRYQGIDGFCDRWFAQITLKERSDPGSKTVLDQYNALAKMTGEVQKLETERRKVDRLTEEEIEAEIQEYLKKMVSPEVYTQEVIENKTPTVDTVEMTGEQLEAALNKEMELDESVD